MGKTRKRQGRKEQAADGRGAQTRGVGQRGSAQAKGGAKPEASTSGGDKSAPVLRIASSVAQMPGRERLRSGCMHLLLRRLQGVSCQPERGQEGGRAEVPIRLSGVYIDQDRTLVQPWCTGGHT